MKWMKSVTIVFDSTLQSEVRGDHNGKYQAVELRLRSDGKMFYLGKHSKVTPAGLKVIELCDMRWGEMLSEEANTSLFTQEAFLADAEQRRKELNGAYL